MDFNEYRAAAEALHARPLDQRHPKGQKFKIGDAVRITNPQSWFAKRAVGRIFIIEYSYHQKYPEMSDGDRHKRTYSLRSANGNRTSWYDEEELEIIPDVLDAEYITDFL